MKWRAGARWPVGGVTTQRLREHVRRMLGAEAPVGDPPRPDSSDPGDIYEAHSQRYSDNEMVGAGASELIGRLELAILELEGLTPDFTLVDLGCGIGRMANHAAPFLGDGHYISTRRGPLDAEVLVASAAMDHASRWARSGT